MPPHPAPTFTTLPPELHHAIISHLHTSNLFRSLTSLATTSRYFLSLCAKTLYSTPHINLSVRTSTSLKRILSSEHAKHVRGLHLSWEETHDPTLENWLDRALFSRMNLTSFTLAYTDTRPSDYWFYELQNALSACYPEHNEPSLFPHLQHLKLERVELNKEFISFLRGEVQATTLSCIELEGCYCLVAKDGFCKYTWSHVFRDLDTWVLTRAGALQAVCVTPGHIPWGDAHEDEEADMQAEAVKALLYEGRKEGRRMYDYQQRYFRSARYFGGQTYTEADVATNRRQALRGEDWAAWGELERTLRMEMGEREKVAEERARGMRELNVQLLRQAGVLMGKAGGVENVEGGEVPGEMPDVL